MISMPGSELATADRRIPMEEIMEERKKGYSPYFFPLPCLSYEESINYDSFISYILSRKEMKKTNLENLEENMKVLAEELK